MTCSRRSIVSSRPGAPRRCLPPPKVVSFAQFSDPEGHVVGLVKRGDEPSVSPGDAPPVSRFHISSTNPTELVDFYRTVFGWRARLTDVRDALNFDVETGIGGIAGSIGLAFPGSSPVVFYASVADADTTSTAPGPREAPAWGRRGADPVPLTQRTSWILRARASGCSARPARRSRRRGADPSDGGRCRPQPHELGGGASNPD